MYALFLLATVALATDTLTPSCIGDCPPIDTTDYPPVVLADEIIDETSPELCHELHVCPPPPVRQLHVMERTSDCHPEVDCQSPSHFDACEADTAGVLDIEVTFVPFWSTLDKGGIFAVASSGIPGEEVKFFKMESGGGGAVFGVFKGVPRKRSLTTVTLIVPTFGDESYEDFVTVRLSQIALERLTRRPVRLQTVMMRTGKYVDGRCEHKDKEPFKAVDEAEIREMESEEMMALNEKLKLRFGERVVVTEVELKLKKKECAMVITSTARPCCVVNPKLKVWMPGRCGANGKYARAGE